MEAELRLHNLGNLVGVGEVEGDACKHGVEGCLGGIANLATLTCRSILGVESCQCGKGRLSTVHPVGILTQGVFHPVDFLDAHLGLAGDNLHLDGGRNHRNAIFGQILEISPHLGGRDGDVLHEFTAHLLDEFAVLELIVHLLPHLRNGHLAVFLEFLSRTVGQLYPIVDLVVDALRDIRLRHFDTVDGSLVQEEFLHGKLFGNGTVGIAFPFHALHLTLHTHRLDVGLEYRLISYHPHHLIDDVGRVRLLCHGCRSGVIGHGICTITRPRGTDAQRHREHGKWHYAIMEESVHWLNVCLPLRAHRGSLSPHIVCGVPRSIASQAGSGSLRALVRARRCILSGL